MTAKRVVLILFWAGFVEVIIWIFTGIDFAGGAGIALMAPAFILCIAQAMRYIEGITVHTFTRTKTKDTIVSACSCGHSTESSGHDASSRESVMAWELRHRAEFGA